MLVSIAVERRIGSSKQKARLGGAGIMDQGWREGLTPDMTLTCAGNPGAARSVDPFRASVRMEFVSKDAAHDAIADLPLG